MSPTLAFVSPPRAVEGGRVSVHGSGFPADSLPVVTIGDHAARVAFASSTRLVVVMPSGLDSGPAPLRVDDVSAEITIAVGGEWAGSVLLSVESADPERRGLFGTATAMGTAAGFLLGTGAFALLSAILSAEQLLSWGWRIPFLVSLVLLALGLWMRTKPPC